MALRHRTIAHTFINVPKVSVALLGHIPECGLDGLAQVKTCRTSTFNIKANKYEGRIGYLVVSRLIALMIGLKHVTQPIREAAPRKYLYNYVYCFYLRSSNNYFVWSRRRLRDCRFFVHDDIL